MILVGKLVGNGAMLLIFQFEDFAHLLHVLASFFFYKAYKTSQKPVVCVYGIVRVVKYYL